MSSSANMYREVEGAIIPGTYLPAFIKNGPFYATEIKIYKDGMIDCWGLVDLEGFKKKIQEGWVRTYLPDNARVCIEGIFFTATDIDRQHGQIEETEFVKQVEDEIRRLNDQPTTWQLCMEAIQLYQLEKSEVAKESLQRAYLAVPKHKRFLLYWNLGNDLENVGDETLSLLRDNMNV